MSTLTVQDVYIPFCNRLLENGGSQLGLWTNSQFLLYLEDTYTDFLKATGICKSIVTQSIQFSVSTYTIPDSQMRVETAFRSGVIMYKTTVEELDNEEFNWEKKRLGAPNRWRADGLPIKQIAIYPPPDYDGVAYPGSGPPFVSPTADFLPTDRNLTTVGAQMGPTSFTLNSPIPLIPDSAVPYLVWGCLMRIFSDDSEMKDSGRYQYSRARFYEGIALFRSAENELLYEDVDEVAAF